jgi:hypothetical protein
MKQWLIPPEANGAFVAAMEEVLAVYRRPHDPDRPLVCLDESSNQLIKETRVAVPMKQGRPARVDYQYERNGTANLFMMFAPLEGWYHVTTTERRTAVDFAHALKDLSNIHFPDAKQIVLVQDDLNTHKKASLYEAVAPPGLYCKTGHGRSAGGRGASSRPWRWRTPAPAGCTRCPGIHAGCRRRSGRRGHRRRDETSGGWPDYLRR